MRNKTNKKGYTLIELIISMGIIIILGALVFIAYKTVSDNLEVKKMTGVVQQLTATAVEFENVLSVSGNAQDQMYDATEYITNQSGVNISETTNEILVGSALMGSIMVQGGDDTYAMLMVASVQPLDTNICVKFLTEAQNITGLGLDFGGELKKYDIKEVTEKCAVKNSFMVTIPLVKLA